MPSNALVTYSLLGGLIISRFGLWTFDLAVSQLLQEWVADGELGASLKPSLSATPRWVLHAVRGEPSVVPVGTHKMASDCNACKYLLVSFSLLPASFLMK